MKIKNPLQFGEWCFYLELDNDNELRIPIQGFAQSKLHLMRAVHAIFVSYNEQGKPEYLQAAMDEAAKMKIQYNDYIGKMVEHQICIRQGGVKGGKCYSSGFGDRLHSVAKMLDAIADVAPAPLERLYEKVVDKVTVQEKPKKSFVKDGKMVSPIKKRLGGCRVCGGSRSFSKQGGNMGRAGRMQ